MCLPHRKKPWVERGIRKKIVAEPKLCFLLLENFIRFRLKQLSVPGADADREKTAVCEGAASVLGEPASSRPNPRH